MSRKVLADYNGYDYKKIFWEDADREYEDAADRMAIRKLLPEKMWEFADLCGGYGRLSDEYLSRAKHATLFDYSKTELEQAQEKYHGKLSTVAGDIYEMPFSDGNFDAVMMIRATHHFEHLDRAMREIHRILKTDGVAVVEVANKKTLPKKIRYILRRSKVNPYSLEPQKIDGYNIINYHPKYVEKVFKEAGFKIDKVLSVSNFRSGKLKKMFGTKRLIRMENRAQGGLLAKMRFAPSIYYRLIKI